MNGQGEERESISYQNVIVYGSKDSNKTQKDRKAHQITSAVSSIVRYDNQQRAQTLSKRFVVVFLLYID